MGDEIQPNDQLRDPLSSSTDPLLAATLAVGKSNEVLGAKVDRLIVQRKGITRLIAVTCVVLIAFCIVASIVLQRVSNTNRIATSVTNEQAQRLQIARADYRTDRTIFCINSFTASIMDNSPYDARCPQAFPGSPITESVPTPR